MDAPQNKLMEIPSVNDCLRALADAEDLQHIPLQRIKHCTRLFLEQTRAKILSGYDSVAAPLERSCFYDLLREYVRNYHTPNLRKVINGTGIIVHTNLGRSLLPQSAMDALKSLGQHYSNLEFNLANGGRGSRYSHVDDLLCELTGCEAALVVNNNAAAVLIALETLARGKEVIISRGQLVEIGGSFRIPDVMRRSGAKLVEVGTTNRTHLRDYEEALSGETGLLLRVHCSNYRIIGFTSEVSDSELVQLGKQHDLPVMEDLGSGSFIDLSTFGLLKEPTVQEVVKSGMDVVTFSGDKLLGGPQAGIIVGKKRYIDKIKRNPLNRALRIDKLTLAALEAVLRLYLDVNQAVQHIPTLAMIAASADEVKHRAEKFQHEYSGMDGMYCRIEVVSLFSKIGGGALPEQNLPSWGLALSPTMLQVHRLEHVLRHAQIPVVARIEDDRLLIDMRTVDDDELPLLAQSLLFAFSAERSEEQ